MRLSNRLKAIEALTPTLKPISNDPLHFAQQFHAAMINNKAEIERLSTHRAQPLKGLNLADRLKMGSKR